MTSLQKRWWFYKDYPIYYSTKTRPQSENTSSGPRCSPHYRWPPSEAQQERNKPLLWAMWQWLLGGQWKVKFWLPEAINPASPSPASVLLSACHFSCFFFFSLSRLHGFGPSFNNVHPPATSDRWNTNFIAIWLINASRLSPLKPTTKFYKKGRVVGG